MPGPPGGRPLKAFVGPALFLGVLFVALWARRPQEQPDPGASSPAGPSEPPAPALRLEGATMGTTWHATLSGQADADRVQAAIQGALDAVDARMSTWKPDSELSLLNAAAGGQAVAVSPELAQVLALSLRVGQESGGAFDVTVAPVVDAWGFGPRDVQSPPTADEIAALMPLVGLDKLVLDAQAGTVTKAAPGVRADLSAVAKGYGVDQAFLAVQALGYDDVMVEVGGELRTSGLNPSGQPWRVGVERPDGSSSVQLAVPLATGAMATSGDYRNFRIVDGQRVSHTIDARTGQPITHGLASVSVLAQDCATADAWATALNVLGPEVGPALAEARGLAAYFIIHDGQAFTTKQTPAWPAPLP